MADRRLTKPQLKELYESTVKMELDPAGFDVAEVVGVEGNLVHEFQHPATRAFFRFDWRVRYGSSGMELEWWPLLEGRTHTHKPGDWNAASKVFQIWLELVKHEVATPDVWQLSKEQRAWLT